MERLDEPEGWGRELAVTAGVERDLAPGVGLEVSGLYGTIAQEDGRFTYLEWRARSAVRVGIRFRLLGS